MTPLAFRRCYVAFTRRRPFQQFVIELHNGRRLLIQHPEALRFRTAVIHFVSPGEQTKNYLFDTTSVSVIRDPEEEDAAPSQ
jgi:hypothetical protein